MLDGEVIQKSLFPDSVEVLGDALEALEDLELRRGFEYLDQARRLDPSLGNLDAIESRLHSTAPPRHGRVSAQDAVNERRPAVPARQSLPV